MNKTRLVSLCVVTVLLLAAVTGSGQAADDKYTIVIYSPVRTGYESLLGEFLITLNGFGYGSGTANVKAAADSGGLAKSLEGGADLIISLPGGVVFDAGVDLGDIPVVFVGSHDPIAEGLVDSLEMPGGNVTGVMMGDLTALRFSVLLDLVPEAETIYVATEVGQEQSDQRLVNIETAAEEAGVALVVEEVDFGADVDELPADIDAIFLLTSDSTPLGPEWPVAALEYGVPLVMQSTAMLEAPYGPVLTLEHDLAAMGVQAANLAVQILEGAAPGELAVMESYPWLTLDLRIAEAIGLDVPDVLLAAAGELLDVESAGELPPLEPDDGMAAEGGACNATLTHPGGTNAVCLDVPCDVPLDAGFIRYTDREPVDECASEGVIGTCAMEAFNMLHYDGEVSAVQRGCVMLMGEWVAPE